MQRTAFIRIETAERVFELPAQRGHSIKKGGAVTGSALFPVCPQHLPQPIQSFFCASRNTFYSALKGFPAFYFVNRASRRNRYSSSCRSTLRLKARLYAEQNFRQIRFWKPLLHFLHGMSIIFFSPFRNSTGCFVQPICM